MAKQRTKTFTEDLLLRLIYDLTFNNRQDAIKDIGIVMCAFGHDQIPGMEFLEYGTNVREILRERYDIDSGLYESICGDSDVVTSINAEGE